MYCWSLIYRTSWPVVYPIMYLGFYTSAGGDNQCFLQETNPQEAAEAEMQKLGKQISIDYKVPPRFPRKKMTKFKEPHYPPRNHQVSSQEGNLCQWRLVVNIFEVSISTSRRSFRESSKKIFDVIKILFGTMCAFFWYQPFRLTVDH